MKKSHHLPNVFNSLTELNAVLGLPAPLHPLITLSRLDEATGDLSGLAAGVMLNFYQISFKQYYSGSIQYGQNHYDFADGGLSFVAPNQLLASGDDEDQCEGLTLLVHPDFLLGHPLAKTIRQYTFFSYAATEALQVSPKEKVIIQSLLTSIQDELDQRIDDYSQPVIIRLLDLLLTYCDRFYHRQFITRKPVHHDVLTKLDELLEAYFARASALQNGVPTVQCLADQLALSPGYLSDLLRSLTGLNAQQHIHLKLIEKAKAHLAEGRLSIAEIAYQLGFEHPQSFTKLFKKKTSLSPLAYQQTLS